MIINSTNFNLVTLFTSQIIFIDEVTIGGSKGLSCNFRRTFCQIIGRRNVFWVDPPPPPSLGNLGSAPGNHGQNSSNKHPVFPVLHYNAGLKPFTEADLGFAIGNTNSLFCKKIRKNAIKSKTTEESLYEPGWDVSK